MYYLNRTLCDVLEDMRRIIKTGVIPTDTLMSLVEEAQCMGNRMEAGLCDLKDKERLLNDLKELRAKKKKLSKQLIKLQPKGDDHRDALPDWMENL